MANIENLKFIKSGDLSHEEAVALGRKGGQATAKKIREAKTFAAAMKMLLKESASVAEKRERLKEMGLEDSKMMAICLTHAEALEEKADSQGLKLMLDMVGESPKINIGISATPSTADELRGLTDDQLRKMAESAQDDG